MQQRRLPLGIADQDLVTRTGQTPRALPLAVAVATVALFACSDERGSAPVVPVTWQGQLEAVFAERCGACHGADSPAAGYLLTDYLGVLGAGTDEVANAIAGDSGSRLVTVLDPASADSTHAGLVDLHPLVRRWVVDSELAYLHSNVHGAGIMNPGADGFHGSVVAGTGSDLRLCAGCHGDDYAGGVVEVGCVDCHSDGPDDCATCHGDLWESGAHGAHLGAAPGSKAFACSECHLVPAEFASPGHVVLADGSVDGSPAEVVFGALAGLEPEGTHRLGPARYDHATGACNNVYCHGDVFADGSATQTVPLWSEPASGACGSCHGLGPEGHALDTCASCHQGVANDDLEITDSARHVDGLVAAPTGCADCHGTGELGSPPPDLHGSTATTSVGVGAHAAHVAANQLRGPIPCSDCHLMPADLWAPAHLDGDNVAEVFPMVEAFTSRARARGAEPIWVRASATCSGVYCHGGGPAQLGDGAAGINREPLWTSVGSGQAACGSCHGMPPTTGFHNPDIELTECHLCHADTVDESGAIIISGAPGEEHSQHIDGTVDTF